MSRKNIENVYSLSPLQEGLLFHALYASQRSVYAVQIAWTLEGPLDTAALRRALAEVVSRHPILRTGFVWERLDRPMQVVRKSVALPFEEQDLTPQEADEQALTVTRFAEAERQRGFDLTRAPLLRFALLTLSEARHRLIWTMHHLITDGWSLPLLVKEIFTLYEAFSRGEAPALDRPRPYGEYIAWLRKQDRARTDAFWKKELQGFTAPTPFRVDRPASTGESLFEERRVVLPEPLAQAIVRFARQYRLTPSTVVQGAWALLLARYSGETDVLFGATVSGRSAPIPGIDRMVGVFINTLPVRVSVLPDQPVLAWLTSLQQKQAELREHEHSPLVEVQGQSEIPRGTPLFESQVAFENYPEAEALVSGKGSLTLAEPAMRSQTHYPITLACALRRELVMHLSYDGRRFDAKTIARMLGHVQRLIESLVEAGEGTLGELCWIPEEERKQLIFGWNQTAEPVSAGACIHALFEAEADRSPEAIALVAGGRSLTYAELDQAANRLAQRLRRLGVGPDQPVGLLVGRSAAAIVGLLGILKAGGAYVPLDPSHPAPRLSQLVNEAGLSVIVSERSLAERIPVGARSLVCADDPSLDDESTARGGHGPTSANLAYVLFTSGSTGVPKGVAVEHRQLVNYVHGIAQRLSLPGRASYAHVSTLSADLGNTVLFPPLCSGGTLHLIAEELTTDPLGLGAYFSEHGIDCLKIVPSHLGALLAGSSSATVLPRTVLVLGGEASSWELIERIERLSPSLRVFNHYGPTETTVGILTEEVERGHRVDGAATVPIGRPLANSRAYVLDTRLQPVPVGVPGELYLGGAGVARGYLNHPELTAKRFLLDPFLGSPERVYRTGDRVRRLGDGRVVFLGRIDHQVKIRGYRIELGEIEAALRAHPGIGDAVVLVSGEAPGDQRLVAYVVARATPGPACDDIFSFLGERLPAYLVPASILTLDALPLTPNGKVDRLALASLGGPDEAEAHEPTAPRGPVEEVVAGIWEDVFGQERIDIHASFPALGGHSLLAIQIIARVREAFQTKLPLRAIFDAPTIAGLSALVESSLREGEGLVVPAIERVSRDAPLRLSFAQERLWFLDQLDPDSALFNVPFGIRLTGALDTPALTGALDELVRRHEVLRTTFAAVDGRPAQIIHPASPVGLPVVDLGGLPESEQDERAREETRAEAERPFDLARGPLVRLRLLRLSPDEHVLLVTMHHIVSDGWTRGIFNREVSQLYTAFRMGAPSPLPELPLQYVDYAAWQRSWLAGEALERQLAYWTHELDGAPLVLELPTDHPRPAVQSHHGRERSVVFSPSLSRSLKDLSRREGVTLYMTLLAALDVLLYRMTGQTDFVVGTSITNRTRAETEKLMGFFINALALRARLSPDLTFQEHLARVRETCLGAYAHEDLPFERLVQALSPEPDSSRSPVFQVIFTMHNAPPPAMKLPGLTLRRLGTEIVSSKYDLTFVMGEAQGAVGCSIAYRVDLFEDATIERMLAHLGVLLEAIVASPEKRLFELPLLSKEERHRILRTWNDSAIPFPEGELVHSLIEAQVDRTPESIALVAGDQALSFRALDARANQLAHRLVRLGVGPDTPVGLFHGRSSGAIVGLLGILKAGGAYVPLDPGHPDRRLTQVATEAGLRVVVSEHALAERLAGGALQVLCLDQSDLTAESETRPVSPARATNLAYVLFTSGSTGMPKGVAVEHRQLVNYVRGVSQRLALPEGGSYAHVSTLSADLGNTVLFPPLCFGGALHLIAEELTTDPRGLGAYFQRHLIDCLKIVPSHLSALLSGAHPETVLPRKVLVLGGEASSWELIERIVGLAPSLRIVNHYGPTETTVGVLTDALVPGERRPGARTVPIGRPLPNSRAYVLDGQMQPVPIGVPGELYLGGAGVARGYLHRPELTEERFLVDPFSGDGGRLYRTGDRVRTLPDGTVVFLGRTDHQLKIRGYRVELGEIEQALLSHPGAREAVVLVDDAGQGSPRLVGYVVPVDPPGPTPPELIRYLEERLPPAWIPSELVLLQALPLTPNGKVDRVALARRGRDLPEIEAAPDVAASAVEEVLTGIWAEVFARESIGLHDSFAELGGHSLLAIQIIARARDAFQVAIPLRSLFEERTIAALASRIEALLREGAATATAPIEQVARSGPLPLPLSFAQERVWFLTELDPASASYNVPLALRLRGALDHGALERALQEIVRRHEVLRTTFSSSIDGPIQIVHPDVAIRLSLDDLSAVPASEREQAARALVARELRHPFDLGRGPLLRAGIVRLSGDDQVLTLTLHHIASDAWARGLLVQELSVLYRSFHRGDVEALPPLPIQYADYAAWQRRWLAAGALSEQLAYWKARLVGAPHGLDLPTDRPRPPFETHRGARLSFRLPPEVGRGVTALARREGATVFMTLLAAFALVLGRHARRRALLVGTPAANRRPEVERLIGLFLNTLVLRLDLDPDASFAELLTQVRETCFGAYAHQDLPFERLVQELVPDRDPSRSPLFQVMFTYLGSAPSKLALADLDVQPFNVEVGNAKFELTFGMGQGPDGLEGTFEYNADLFDPATIERLADHLRTLLSAVVERPDERIGALPILPPWEREQLLVGWNQTRADYPRDRSVEALFLEQVERTPDAIAVTHEGASLSYRALELRSRSLALTLTERGVGRGSRVGVALPRSLDLLVGVLAVWRAGAAYVPLDPTYPLARLDFMIRDAGLALLLTADEVSRALPEAEIPRLVLRSTAVAEGTSTPDLPARSSADDLAYVIYTSGSTGTPKGVEISHRSLANLLWSMRTSPGIEPTDRLLAVTSLSFDIAGLELFLPLMVGAQVEIAGSAIVSDGAALGDRLARSGITIMQATPSTYRLLLDAGWEGRPGLTLLVGGEAVPRELANRLIERARAVWNMYGPTETTIWSCVARLDHGEAPVSIGRPIANTVALVLDDRLDLLPIGVPGELFLGGDGVARGYSGRAELTAARFLPDPFRQGERLYRTGDLCRARPDGSLEFLGRLDHQIKLRGHRIELGEIESALLRQPEIAEAVVVARDHGAGDLRLVAYLVAAGAPVPPAAELKIRLRDALPEVMVPSAYVVLPALPLTDNGKVNRQALPAPAEDEPGTSFVAPRGPIEEALARIFAEVLGIDVERIGAHDGFFALGGHSLLGARAMARIRAALGVEVPLRALFETSSLAELGAEVDAALRSSASAALGPIARVSREGVLLPSFAEERLWFLSELDPGAASYVVPLSLRLSGPLDAGALERALTMLVERHEILRTTYARSDDRPVRIIHAHATLPLTRTALVAIPEEERDAAIAREARIEVRIPFDLRVGPLLRARLIELAPDDHALLVTMHHIVTDAWSIGILLAELSELYAAIASGRSAHLAALPIQYADHAADQRQRLQGAALADELAYWRAALDGAPTRLVLPADHEGAPDLVHRADRIAFAIDPAVTTALGELSRRERATLFMTLLAAFATLLGRWSGQEDLLLGAPIANRGRKEVEGLVGFFVNTLVLRARPSSDLTFTDLLQQVRESCLGAYAHQDLPFERLVQAIAPDRHATRTPLVQAIFALQNMPREQLSLPGLLARPFASDLGPAKFDLSLTLSERRGGLAGTLIFDAERFDRTTVERLIQSFTTLLQGIVANPSERVGALPLLDERERAAVLVLAGGPRVPRPEACIHDLVHARIDEGSAFLAVRAGDRSLSYRELGARSRRLAHHLRARGVGQGSLVGVCLERSIETVVALFGVLLAGAAYVAMDPAYPTERLVFQLHDARVVTLITSEPLAGRFTDAGVPLLRIDTDWPAIEAESDAPLSSGVGPDDLAYVIYTSGSTGVPKGVELLHRGLVNLCLWHLGAYALSPADRCTHLAAPGFDASVWEIWPALLAGACLFLPDEGTKSSPPALKTWLVDQGITVSFLPTPLAEAVLVEPWPPGAALRVLLTGGDRLRVRPPPGLPFRLINHYGPTECTVVTTAAEITPEGEGAPSIGRAIDNLSAFVLDARLVPVPRGAPGELVIAGVGLSRGYLGQPALTASRFVACPWAGPETRVYRSGDRVRARANGELEFLGRLDDQVKIRGNRVELGEIEAALLRQTSSREVAVVLREDPAGQARLVAYLADVKGLSLADLRTALRGSLLEYMIPSALVLMDVLPSTVSGKIDRRSLPDPSWDLVSEEPSLGAGGPVEEAVVAIFAEVLHLDITRVGPAHDFFELGGHSLLATQVLSRIQRAFGIELPLLALFEGPSARALAARVDQALRGGRVGTTPALTPAPRDAPLPLSFAQERLWFLDQLSPGDVSYVIPLAVRLEGPLAIEPLRRALEAIVHRHESLRTTFVLDDARPVQRIHGPAPFVLPITRWPSLAPGEREPAARRAAAAEVSLPFDLGTGPLFRARLLEVGAEDHLLLLSLHHIVADGWSTGVLSAELSALYRAFARGEPSPLPELPIQAADHAVWQRRWLDGPVLAEQLGYWRSRLEGAPEPIDLPTDRPRPSVESHRGGRVPIALSGRLTEGLRALSRREGATLFMTLLGAFSALLHRITRQSDLMIGSPIAGRTRPEIERLLGLFVNTLVLRVEIDPSLPFRSLLAQVKETCLGAYAHQDLPFERLVQALAPERDLARSPLFQVLFTLQNAPQEGLQLPGLRVRGVPSVTTSAKLDLTLALREGRDGLAGSLEYAADLFDVSTIERMATHLVTLLEGVIANPDLPLADLPLLTGEERNTLLVTWNDTGRAPLPEVTFPALFAAQAERTPEATAVTYEGASLTYRVLRERGEGLSRHLRARGIGQGARVGIAMDRGLGMMIGLLGILGAGAAYVPLDPAYPRERLSFMIEDAGLSLLLTEAHLGEVVPEPGIVRLVLDGGGRGEESGPAFEGGAGLEDLAYVIYTSGSTGKPKGVEIPHRALTNFLLSMREKPGLGAEDRLLAVTSLSFDIAGLELFLPLIVGAEVEIASRALAMDGAALAARMVTSRITAFQATPTTYRLLLEGGFAGSAGLLAMIGGEAVPRELAGELGRRCGAVWNMYGPTETTIWSCIHRIEAGEGSVPIGRPIAHTTALVLDEGRGLVPIGVPGELYLGGAGLARGYHARPELTAERFVASPYGPARLYRTGDLCRWRADGTLEFLGRLDQQVKLRGYRIELGEIESVLAEHPEVRAAVALVREDHPGERRLVAYVTVVGDTEGGENPAVIAPDLRGFLRGRLPDYMVPNAFVVLERLPLTPNGKIDRKALPRPEPQPGSGSDVRPTAPPTEVEERLAAIWAAVLRRERVGVDENFFEIGGDSISSIQIVVRAKQAGLALTPRQLFEHQTITELARVVEAARSAVGEQGPVTGSAPLTPIQRWWLEQGLVAPKHWNQAFFVESIEALDPAALERAFAALLAHHDALRVRLREGERGIEQWFAPVDGASSEGLLRVVDLGSVALAERADVMRDVASALQNSLDPTSGPVLRAALFRGDDAAPDRLLVAVHHLAIDWISWMILLDDLGSAHQQARRGEAIRLPPKTTSFKRWAEILVEEAEGPTILDELGHWLATSVREAPPLVLDHDRGENTEASARSIVIALDAEQMGALAHETARAYRAEIEEVVLAAFAEALSRWQGSPSVLFDREGHGRDEIRADVDLARTVGWFTTAYPVLLRIAPDEGPSAVVASIKTQLRAIPNRGRGHGLLRYLRAEDDDIRALRSLPPAEIVFNHLGRVDAVTRDDAALRRASVDPGPTHGPENRRFYRLEVTTALLGERLQARFTYSENHHEAATIQALADHFREALQRIVAHGAGLADGDLALSDLEEEGLSQEDIRGMLDALDGEDLG